MPALYPIVDVYALERAGIPPLDFARAVLAARPRWIQLRHKDGSPRDTLALLRALRPLASSAGAWLFANDRPDLALLAGCDGVHVGQDDLPVEAVRALSPGLRVGVSTHSPAQLREALAACPDYVSYGPVFPTTSKRFPDPVVGLDGLARAARQACEAGSPLVAIGGIDLQRASQVAEVGAQVAVIGCLIPGPGATEQDITDRVRALQIAVGERQG